MFTLCMILAEYFTRNNAQNMYNMIIHNRFLWNTFYMWNSIRYVGIIWILHILFWFHKPIYTYFLERLIVHVPKLELSQEK